MKTPKKDIRLCFSPPDNCCGCFACVNICTLNAVSMKENKEGFLYPQINQELCKHCGLCETVCPSVNNIQNPNNIFQKPDAYAACFTVMKKFKKKVPGKVYFLPCDSAYFWKVVLYSELQLEKIYRFNILVLIRQNIYGDYAEANIISLL